MILERIEKRGIAIRFSAIEVRNIAEMDCWSDDQKEFLCQMADASESGSFGSD